MTPISVCTIVKNEEKHILNFLNALKDKLGNYPHEIVITDTGSTDKTLSLIEGYAPDRIRLFHFDWIGDFAAAKNASIRNAKNDHILFLDADEYLRAFDPTCIGRMIEQYPDGIGMIERSNRTATDGVENVTNEQIPRFFDRRRFHYEGIIHEQLCRGSVFDAVNTRDIPALTGTDNIRRVTLPIRIDHCGYIGTAEEIRAKAERNNALLFQMLKKAPDDPYLYYQLGQSYAAVRDYEKAYVYYGKALEFDVDPKLDYVIQTVVGYGYAMLETNRYEEALSYEGIYEDFKGSADFLCLMGLIYLRNGRIEEAYKEFTEATQPGKLCATAGADSYLAFYNMGVIDEALGNTDRAKELYEKCGSFAPAVNRLSELSK